MVIIPSSFTNVMDMVPPTQTDVYVTMTMMLLGAILFAVFINYLTSVAQSHNVPKRLYADKYSSVKHYMIFRKLPLELRNGYRY